MGKNILVVENHPDSAYALAALLRKAGHTVVVAETYHEAQTCAAARKPDVVLCDIGLADGDGCDLMRELRQMYNVAGIAVTGSTGEEDKQRCLQAGFSEFVGKPYQLDQIKNAIVRAGLFAPRIDPRSPKRV